MGNQIIYCCKSNLRRNSFHIESKIARLLNKNKSDTKRFHTRKSHIIKTLNMAATYSSTLLFPRSIFPTLVIVFLRVPMVPKEF